MLYPRWVMRLTVVAIVGMLGWVQWLMDYLVFVVRELLLVAKDLRQKHYDSFLIFVIALTNRGTRYSAHGVHGFHFFCENVSSSRYPCCIRARHLLETICRTRRRR